MIFAEGSATDFLDDGCEHLTEMFVLFDEEDVDGKDVEADVDVEDITEFDFDDVEDVREEEGCGCFFCWFVVVWTELLLTLELEDLPSIR